jgi:PKD repeat protein
MKKTKRLLGIFLIFFITIQIQSQNAGNEQKATLILTSETMIEVPSIASQIIDGTFVPAVDIKKEVNPKRWGKNTSVPGKGLPKGEDPLWQKQKGTSKSPGREPILTFVAASATATPTDPTGAVGPNHFVNSWNSSFRIWDKAGNPLTNAASLGTILPGTLGDPIVIYDPYADRFLITEFFSNGFDVAICQGSDPVNDGWYVYRFATNTFPDYPKFSVWSDGYYITANKDQNSASTSEVVFALERDRMISGDPTAQMVGFPLTNIVTSGFYSPLGFNCNGSTLPPAGNAPIVYMQDDSWSGVSTDHLKIWNINVNWVTPANSTISSPQIINTAPFDGLFDGGSFSNLPQPSGGDIDALQATIMYMAQYRRFPTYNTVVFNFVVDLDGNDDYAGIRWYELRQDDDGDPWTIYQEGTYSQPDGHSAFSGNMCMDASGNIALAYTCVSTSLYPSLRYTGRYANDPTGTMTLSEEVIVNGTQSDPSTRYGDYSQMTIDPVDDATFWSIGEYFSGGRKNHVGVFQIAPPALTSQFTGNPVNVCTGGTVTFTDNSLASPTSWNWTFEGGTPATYSGQTPPPIAYNTVGTYDVTLVVGDGNTTSSLTLTDYITVQDIIADFSANPTTVIEGNSVSFTDLSACDPNSWVWAFPGGVPASYSGASPPPIVYNTLGSYGVTLTATNSNGTDIETKTDYIHVISCVLCETSYSNQSDDWISNVSFNTIDNTTVAEPGGYGDYSSISTEIEEDQTYTLSVDVTVNGSWTQHVWAWIDWNMNCDFTDQGEAYDLGQTPGTQGVHTLSLAITVPVGLNPNSIKMRVSERFNSNPEPCTETTYGEAEDYTLNIITNALPPVAEFMADNLTPTIADTVSFTDMSANDPTSWSWSFDPGTIEYLEGTTSSSQHPVVRFAEANTYTVELNVTNNAGNSTETKTDYINATLAAPLADFMADNLNPTIEDTVSFTDLSEFDPTSWSWVITPSTIEYLEGTDASSQHPKIKFLEVGSYTVELTATNSIGSDIESKPDYIVAMYPAPVVDFEADDLSPTTIDTVLFTDLSTNYPDEWEWAISPATVTYAEGTSASSQYPLIIFDEVGLYSIELTATNAAGSGSESKIDYIDVREALSVDVTASVEEICLGGSVQLNAEASGGSGAYTYNWTSEPEGFVSTDPDPIVSPEESSIYIVEVDDGEHIVNGEIEIIVNPLPEIMLIDWPESLCNQEEPPIQLEATPTGGLYSGSNVTPDGIFSPEEAPLGWNVITYTYVDENNCEASVQDSIFIDDCLFTKEFKNDISVQLFPNPNSGVFTVKSNQMIDKIEVVDQNGKLLYSKQINDKTGRISLHLVQGAYYVRTFFDDLDNKQRMVTKELLIK